MTVFALDPGGTTGVAGWEAGVHRSLEISDGFHGFVEWAGDQEWRYVTDVVIENFIVNPATHKKDPVSFRTTNDIIGAVRYICNINSIHYRLQPPSAKTFGDNAKLKHLGWYKGGKGHADDASRHLLRHLAQHKDPVLLEALRGLS